MLVDPQGYQRGFQVERSRFSGSIDMQEHGTKATSLGFTHTIALQRAVLQLYSFKKNLRLDNIHPIAFDPLFRRLCHLFFVGQPALG